MRIAYLAGRRLPSRQANAVQIGTMCSAFAEAGHAVTLYGRAGDAPAATFFARVGVAESFAVEVLRPRWRPLHKLFFPGQLRRRLDAAPPLDLFYGRDADWLLAAAGRGVPLVFEAHQIYPPGSRRRRRLEALFARPDFARLVCVTSTLADHYRGWPALAERSVLVSPVAGAPLPDLPPVAPWPGRAGAMQVGFVGRPYPGKGLEAMHAAAGALPDTDFHIVGADAGDARWLPPSPPNLHWHGYRPHGELAAWYARFDVASAPYGARISNASGVESAAVTSPLKLPEYWVAGLPVVAADLPGVRDLLGGADAALLVPPGDHDAFVAAIARLRDDPALRLRLAEAGRALFRDRLTASARARAVLADLA